MMKVLLQTLFLTTFWAVATTKGEISTLNYTMKLLQDLMENYDNRLRPLHDQHDIMVVNMSFHLSMIRSFDDVSGEITLLGTFTMLWMEERLTWQPSHYSNITELILPKIEVWHPDLFLETSLDTLGHPGKAATKVLVASDGRAMMKSTDLLTSICPVDVTNYPNDYQSCYLSISPTGYSKKQMRLSKSSLVLHNVSNNNEWEVLEILSSENLGNFDIEIRLKRHSTYATMTMTVPIYLLGILNPWVFFLPPDSGERTSYSITTFLAFTVYMGILTDNMPKGSMPMADLMFQVFSMLIYSVVILFCTIVSLKIHMNEGKKPVPGKVQTITQFLSFACLRNKRAAISNMVSHAENEKTQPTVEYRVDKRRFSLKRYSSGYMERKDLPTLRQNESANTESLDCPASPAKYETSVTWQHVGNVFDRYMLALFGLWFLIVILFFRV